MKSLFEADSKEEILNRINQLSDTSTPQWGIMNIDQMLYHCQGPLEVAIGKKQLNTEIGFMKKLVFKLFKSSLYNDKSWKENMPTARDYIAKGKYNFNEQKTKLEAVIEEFSLLKEKSNWPAHPFFGKLTTEQWGKSQYKHLDHHLKQFGV